MSQATNKEVDFSSQQHFQLLPCLIPHRFHCRLNTLSLKIKTELNLTLAASVIYSMLDILCGHLVCGCGKTKSPASLTMTKRVLKKEKIRSPNDA